MCVCVCVCVCLCVGNIIAHAEMSQKYHSPHTWKRDLKFSRFPSRDEAPATLLEGSSTWKAHTKRTLIVDRHGDRDSKISPEGISGGDRKMVF